MEQVENSSFVEKKTEREEAPHSTMPFSGEDMMAEVQNILVEIQSLRHDFETKVQYDESKERLISSLHQELQTYREGLHFKILRPLFIDLITLYDDFGKIIDSMRAKSSESDQHVQNLESFQEAVEEILRRHGVDTYEVEGATFVASKQKISRVVSTAESELDKHIARRVRKGFQTDGRILRPETVETYKHTPSLHE